MTLHLLTSTKSLKEEENFRTTSSCKYQQQRKNNNPSETSEDNMPSKMNDPQKLQDTIALNNILDTMKKRQNEKKVDVADTSVEYLTADVTFKFERYTFHSKNNQEI